MAAKIQSAIASATARAWRGLGLLLLVITAHLGCGRANLLLIAGDREGQVPDAVVPAVVLDRGRVSVAGGTVVTDRGTLLRAIDLPLDIRPDFPLDHHIFQDTARQQGLNAVLVYLEHWDIPTGAHAALGDVAVEEARLAGLYVILGVGGGPAGDGHPGNGWFDIDKVRSFWQFYAPRYKDRTHVLFEIQNQPELACDAPWQADTLAMEREAYSLIRSLAPDTHVILFSYRGVPAPAALTDSVGRVADRVDFSNASVGMEGSTSCVAATDFNTTFAAATGLRAPIIITGLPTNNWADSVHALELARIGWTSMRWLAVMPDFSTFQTEHDQAGLRWCPDFGAWPQNSATCSAF